MINKKIALSGLSIFAALAIMGGATFAFFSDQATSQDNTFSTGSADLQIADDILPPGDPGTYANDITGVTVSGMLPGETRTTDFWLKNNSSGEFSMSLTGDLADLGGTTPGDLPNQLLIQFTCDTDNDGLATGNSSTVEQSVNAWIAGSEQTLGTVGANDGPSDATNASDQDEMLCRMSARLPNDADNTLAGKDLSFDGIFDGTQVAAP